MSNYVKIGGDIKLAENKITGGVATEHMAVGGNVALPVTSYYRGEYTITPSSETQTISIKGKTALNDIVVAPVPSNYGRITWDGAGHILTVS